MCVLAENCIACVWLILPQLHGRTMASLICFLRIKEHASRTELCFSSHWHDRVNLEVHLNSACHMYFFFLSSQTGILLELYFFFFQPLRINLQSDAVMHQLFEIPHLLVASGVYSLAMIESRSCARFDQK